MNIMIYTLSNYTRNMFVNALLPAGITLYQADLHENLIGKMERLSPDIVVLDAIQENISDIVELVKVIKNHPADNIKKAAAVLLICNIDRQDILLSIQAGVIGFIRSNSSMDYINKYLVSVYQKVRGAPPERKFVRVPYTVNISFRSPASSQLIIGKIRDFSIGGIAVELGDRISAPSMDAGMFVKNMQFILDGRNISVDGIVVTNCSRLCGFRFFNISPEIKEIFSQFIFKRISASEKNGSCSDSANLSVS